MSKYSFTEVTGPPNEKGSGKGESGGCHVKTATGFVLGFLAIAIAVGAGLIVHFAENRKIECVFPEGTVVSSQHGGSNAQSVQCPEAPPATPCPVCAERICPSCTLRCEPCPTPNPVTRPTTTCPPPCEPCPTKHTQTNAECPTPKQCEPCATQHPDAHAQSSTIKPKPKFVRLPTDMIPLHYDLVLNPDIYGSDPKAFKFEGTVDILLLCQKSTDEIILHADNLDIKTVEVRQNGSQNIYARHSLAEDLQQLSVRLTRPTATGTNYTLRVAFQGPLLDDMRGFYYSSYQEGNSTMYLAVTQFEPTDARKAFPCFDEPAMKATFKVTLIRKKNFTSLSNMVLSKTVIRNDSVYEDTFDTSLKMSTYLAAFYVGKLDKYVAATKRGLLYGAWARPQYIDQTHLASDVGRKTIVNYEDYFNISFPLPKQDMIAIPDFAAGAMENWGLITYRETAMLFNPEVSSEANRQRVVTVVTHELAHQWFGDLVTMAWWDDLWLNEGFARFVQYLGTDKLFPDWQMWDQFILLELHRAFELDALVTSHPIYVPVNDPVEINEIFDTISYSKGGSIIRMMRFILGPETFKKGLTRYLNDHRYRNAHKEDLWTALNQQSVVDGKPVDVQGIMDTWTEQMNYPVVMVTKIGGNIRLQQKRFLQNKRANETGKYTSRYGYRWEIPFTYTSSRQPTFQENVTAITWFHANETTKDIPLAGGALSDEDWLLGNVNQLGFYRVNYDEVNWRALVRQIKTKHTVISNINRAQIINDAWSLSKAGELSTTIALSTLEYLEQEVDYVPWLAARTQLDYLNNMLRRTDMYGSFKSFMRSTLAEPFRHYGMDDTNATHVESLTRNLVADLACSYGLQECVSEASRLYEMWMGDPGHNPIDPDLRSAVYCTAIAAGGEREWQFALDMYMAAEVATEKVTLTFALACTRETWLLRRYLELSITSEVVRKQDAASVLVYIGGSDVGQMLAWDFVRDRWDYLYNTYGKGVFSFTNLISGLTQSFNTEAQLKQLHQFLEEHPDMGTGNRAFRMAIETTESNIRWMADNQKSVSDWLKNLVVTSTSRVKDVRLPTHLVPDVYDIVLQPNMYDGEPDNFNFEGYVKIHMTAKEAGKNVTLHANKLTILESSIRFGSDDGGNTGPSYTGVHVPDKARQFEVFFLDSALVPGRAYFIEMNFTGPLTGDLAGLYLSQYERGNQTVYIATSQMEATDARKAFPCFDEPAIKAVFNVKLVRKPHMKSISNMPIFSNYTLNNGMVVDVFNQSAKMSTYLLALIVCEFDYIENKTKSGITYRAWARPEYINQAKVALEAGVKIITYYEEYFGAQFPLPKQDMIAIPDFAAGAMENWGLITYRETAMLYEPGVSSEANLQRVNVVIAHELAHQWFGDLVTMDWWDDLWLNEGFASFVEYMGTDLLHPDWKMFEQFVLDIYEVFDIDALVTSHPIYVPVFNPDEINEIFDTISYSKGGSVLRMMRFFLGEDTFKRGIQNYIQGRKYQNAKHDDLWAALGNQSRADNKQLPAPVKEILDTWILQMNYPVVKVTKDQINNKTKITQTRFLKNREAKDPMTYTSPFDYKWHIPFTFMTKTSIKSNITDADVVWLTEEEKVINTSYPTGDNWILGNVQQYGVYRVNYEYENWDALIKQLNTDHKVFSAINRGQLINDAFGLAAAGQLIMSYALRTLDYLTAEEEYIPWRAAIAELGYISSMLKDTEIYGLFSKLILDKVQKQFDRLPMNNSIASHLDSYVRSDIASLACSYGNTQCVEESRRLFKEYMDNDTRNPIDPGLKSTVYCTAVQEGRETEWTFTYRMYKNANVEAEKSRLLTSLACTQQPWILNKLLSMALDDREVRQQDAYKVFIDVGRNPVGRTLAWDFFRSRWDDIFEKYGSGSFSLNDIISGVTASFNTELHLQQLRDFGKSHANMGSGTRAFAQTIENTLANIRWMRENYVIIENWLNTQKIPI